MNINDIPLFQVLKGRLSHLTHREQVIAENVANAATPGYVAHDLKPFTIRKGAAPLAMGPVAQAKTNMAHMAGTQPTAKGAWKRVDAPDSEITLDGNQVVLEEQMLKMTEARMNYDAAIGFYQKSLNLLRMAARPPGRG